MSQRRNMFVATSCLGLALLGAACTSREPTSRAHLSSAELSTSYTGAAAESAKSGAYAQALAFAERAVAAEPANPWAHYDRGVALQRLQRTDEAVDSYRAAEGLFGDADKRGKSISIYGRARALDDVGRCAEARAAYAEYAAFVRSSDGKGAQMADAYAEKCREAVAAPGETTASTVTSFVVARDYARALTAADEAARWKETESPWLDYDRGVAFSQLGRTDEAVQAFRKAEQQFAVTEGPTSRWARSISIYGRARALSDAKRCAEAKHAYEEYAAFIELTDRRAAEKARAMAKGCGAS